MSLIMLLLTRLVQSHVPCSTLAEKLDPTYTCVEPDSSQGEGASGVTYLLADEEGKFFIGKAVSLKTVRGEVPFQREIDVMVATKGHPNIIQLYAANKDEDYGYFLLEYGSRGTLFDIFADRRRIMEQKKLMNFAFLANFFRQLALGLKRMHKKKWVHCDIKLENVVVTRDYTPKLIDFDLAQPILTEGNLQGTPHTMAPEMFFSKYVVIREENDVYGLGCLFYAMLHHGYYPFLDKPYENKDIPDQSPQKSQRYKGKYEMLKELLERTAAGEIKFRANLEARLIQVISLCLQIHPENRLTIDSFISMIDEYLADDKDIIVKEITVSNARKIEAEELQRQLKTWRERKPQLPPVDVDDNQDEEMVDESEEESITQPPKTEKKGAAHIATGKKTVDKADDSEKSPRKPIYKSKRILGGRRSENNLDGRIVACWMGSFFAVLALLGFALLLRKVPKKEVTETAKIVQAPIFETPADVVAKRQSRA